MLLFILILTTAGFTYGIIIQRTVYESQGSTQFSHRGMRPQCASKCVMQLRHSQSSGVKYTGFTTAPCFCSTVAISEDKEPGKGYAMKREVITQYDPPAIAQKVNRMETSRFVEEVSLPLAYGSRMTVTLNAPDKYYSLNWVVDESNTLLHILTLWNGDFLVDRYVNYTWVDRQHLELHQANSTDLQEFSVIFYTGFVHIFYNGQFLKKYTIAMDSSAVTRFEVHADNPAFPIAHNTTCYIYRIIVKSPFGSQNSSPGGSPVSTTPLPVAPPW